MRIVLSLVTVLLLPVVSVIADTTDTYIEPKVDTLLFQPLADSSLAVQVTNPVNYEKHLTQNPTVALFKSMFVPGLGQLGNRRYIKAFVIAGLETWFIGSAIHYGRQASDFRRQWDEADDVVSRNILYGLYEDSRDERHKFTWFAGIVIFVSMFDAYVDAHLSGSPAREKDGGIELEIVPQDNGGVSALLSCRF
jgi:hypothetical protein